MKKILKTCFTEFNEQNYDNLLFIKKLKDGEIKLTDEFKVSKKAWKKGGSKMFVNVGESVKVEDLIRGIIVQSGNDACIVVAEAISGSEDLFAEELNLLGQELV